jgi:hypothetical protein
VTDLIDETPVAPIVAPVQDLLTGLPIVGDVIVDVGVPTVIEGAIGVIDTTTPIVGGVVENTVSPVLTSVTPAWSATPARQSDSDPLGTAPLPSITAGADAATGAYSAAVAQSRASGHTEASDLQPAAPTAASATTAPASDDSRSASSAPPAGVPSAPSSSAGSSGASSFSPARLGGDVGLAAPHAVVRTPGAPDDVLPTSPVADADVSPD